MTPPPSSLRHEPIALWPSLENPHDPTNVETHCFSGCIFNGAVSSEGGWNGAHADRPKLFYTKVNIGSYSIGILHYKLTEYVRKFGMKWLSCAAM
jgi:hypothetical protein